MVEVNRMNTKNRGKDLKAIREVKESIQEETHYLLEDGMSHEEIVLFLEELKMDWMAKYTYETLVRYQWIKPAEDEP